jgi:hypothetical protein
MPRDKQSIGLLTEHDEQDEGMYFNYGIVYE